MTPASTRGTCDSTRDRSGHGQDVVDGSPGRLMSDVGEQHDGDAVRLVPA
jgi:hypothetical protein